MYKNILKSTAVFFILVGIFIYAFGIYKTGLTVIQQQQITYPNGFTWTFYKIDVPKYLQNIDYSLHSVDQFGNFGVGNIPVPSASFKDVITALKTLLNWISFGINTVIHNISFLLVTPLKIFLYPLNVIYAIFGLNTSSNDWIAFTTSVYNFHIPYIPYI